MGKIEKVARRKRVKRNIQGALIAAVAAAGAVTLAAAVPGIMIALGRIGNKSKFAYRARTAAGRLVDKGLAEFFERDGKRFIRLTPKGERAFALTRTRGSDAIRKPLWWDRRYRIVMFDIPEYRKAIRNKVREIMKSFGFLRLQDSVWVHPYDCEDLIALLKAELRIGKDLLYVIAEEIENDRWIRKHFGLR